MNRCGMLIAAAVLFLLLTACGDAQAQWPGAWGWPGGGWYLVPRDSRLEKLPHFALFPPVHYSYPVPRTYGYSPFASLPELRISETTRVEPLTIRNPFVPQRELATEPEGRSSAAPLVVRNPYVDQDHASERSIR